MDHLKRLQLKVLSWSLQVIVTLNLRSENLRELKKNIPPKRTKGLLAATEALQAELATNAEGPKPPFALASSGSLAEVLFIFHLLNFTGTETDQEPKLDLL